MTVREVKTTGIVGRIMPSVNSGISITLNRSMGTKIIEEAKQPCIKTNGLIGAER